MSCPEGVIPNEGITKEKDEIKTKTKKMSSQTEGAPSLELNSYKNPRTWKKSITHFFRNQLRSTKSNEGDRPSESQDDLDNKDNIPAEQKWQSLGKIFRRQSYDNWSKASNQAGETSEHKRLSVTKVLNYFGKPKKTSLANVDK